MRTPAGKECKYFYGDYYRGRNQEECQLLQSANPPQAWNRELCFDCPVPEVTLANSCSHMVLHPLVQRTLLIFKKQVKIEAYCEKTGRRVAEPHIGCGECHPLPPIFTGEPGESNLTD
jgi:hypothetical protein